MSDSDQRPDNQKPETQTPPPRLLMQPSPPFDLESEKRADIQDKQDAFFRNFAEFQTVGKACQFTGISRAVYERWKEFDFEFKQRWNDAREAANDDVEARMFHNATADDVAPGAQVRAGEIWLKAHRPDVYDPKREGTGNGVVINLILGKRPDYPALPDPNVIDVKAEDASS